MLSKRYPSGRSWLAVLLLGCLLVNCLQMPLVMQMGESPQQATDVHAAHMMGNSEVVSHGCCEPDSSYCPLEIPLAKLFQLPDNIQYYPLFWLPLLSVGLLALALLRLLRYRSDPSLFERRSCSPGYPRLHLVQAVFRN